MSTPSASPSKQRLITLLLGVLVVSMLACVIWWIIPRDNQTLAAQSTIPSPQPDNLAQAQECLTAGNTLEASAAFERVINDPTATEEHYRLALIGMGKLALAERNFDEAVACLRAAAGLVSKNLEPILWSEVQTEVAKALIKDWKQDEAELLLREILLVQEAHLEPVAPKLIDSLDNLFDLTLRKENAHEAMGLADSILKKTAAIWGPDHPKLLQKIEMLASSLRSSHPREAVALMERRLAILDSAERPDIDEILRSLGFIENTLEDANYLEAAEPFARRIFAMIEKRSGHLPPIQVDNRLFLGRHLLKAQKTEEAESIIQEAYQIQMIQADNLVNASISADLATVLADLGRLSEAEAVYRIALAAYKRDDWKAEEASADCLNKLAEILDTTNRLPEAEPILLDAAKLYMNCQSPNSSPSDNAINVTANYLRTARALQRSDEEVYARLNAIRAQTKLSQTKFEELWMEVLAKNPRS